jgi:hypothetical protein
MFRGVGDFIRGIKSNNDDRAGSFDDFLDVVLSERADFMSFQNNFDVSELRPTYEQLPEDRVADEVNRNLLLLKALDSLIHERSNAHSSFVSNTQKQLKLCEDLNYGEGSLLGAFSALKELLECEKQFSEFPRTTNDLRSTLAGARTRTKDLSRYCLLIANVALYFLFIATRCFIFSFYHETPILWF